jgi:hypothetical protein
MLLLSHLHGSIREAVVGFVGVVVVVRPTG